MLNGEPTTYDVVHARGGKLRFATAVLDEVIRLLSESKTRIQGVVASNAARLPMSDALLACADRAIAAANQVRGEVEDRIALFLDTQRGPSGDLTAIYRSLVAEEQRCRDARKAMLEIGNRVTFASDALVNELYDNYYESHLEGALERIFWRLTDQGRLELVVRHWQDKVPAEEGRAGFRQALLDLAEALAKEVWNRRLASGLEKDLWRRDHVAQTSQNLWVQAEPLLEFRPDQAPRVEKQRFLWINPGLSQANKVAEQVSVAGTGSGTARTVRATDPFAAGLLTWVDVLPLQATQAFERTNDEYLRAHALTATAQSDQRGQRVEPVQVFRAEAIALAYERRLSELREPPRLFHPLYVAALEDLERARMFVLAYALGLVRRGYENGLYRYGVQLPGDAAVYWLPERTQQFRTVDALVEAQQEFVLDSPDGSITAAGKPSRAGASFGAGCCRAAAGESRSACALPDRQAHRFEGPHTGSGHRRFLVVRPPGRTRYHFRTLGAGVTHGSLERSFAIDVPETR